MLKKSELACKGGFPVRTANGKVLIMQIIKTFFLFMHNRISYFGSTRIPNNLQKQGFGNKWSGRGNTRN